MLMFVYLVFGQTDPSSQNLNGSSNTASPNVSGFIRFQESPVNYYNGRGNLTIPIFEINVGGLNYPISLNYSHGGIQVNSMASDVGLGWSLSSAFINRTVIGDADLETINDGTTFKKKYGYFDYLGIGVLDSHGSENNVDFYPDLFNFVSPNNSSNFYFITKTQAKELDQKGTKINWTIEQKKYNYLKNEDGYWVNNNIDISDYKDFELVTKDGISYSFTEKDITHSFSKSAENEFSIYFGNINGTYPRVSSWNVSKIKNLNNNEEINFIYETYSSENSNFENEIIQNHPYYSYESKYPNATVEGYDNNIYFRTDNQGSSYDSDYGKFYNRLLNIQRIKKILFRGGSVEFNYDLVRQDLTNGKALTSITVKDTHDKIIKEFLLEYGYFQSILQKNEFSKRLKLVSIKEKGNNKYEFNYYEDTQLPNIGSPLQDFFGYNNAIETTVETPTTITSKYYFYPNKLEYSILPYNIPSDNNHYLMDDQTSILEGQIDKEPNDLSKIWSLKSVKFPTGGINTYYLESNTFNLWGNNLKGGGVRIQKQTIQEQAGAYQRTINYYYNKDTNTTSGYLFNVPFAGYPTSILYPNTNPSPDLSNFNGNLKSYFMLFNNAKINYDIVNNFFIGYSKVEEVESGIKTIYEFKNEEVPNILTRSYDQEETLTYWSLHPMGEFIMSNSAYGNNFYIDNSYRRGKLKYLYTYDKNNILLSKKEYVYQGYYEQGTGEDIYNGTYIPGTAIYHNPLDNYMGELMQFKKPYYTTNYNLIYRKVINYLPSGNIVDENNFYYDVTNQNLMYTYHKKEDGVTYPLIDLKKYSYPYDMNGEPFMSDLMSINKIDNPALVQNYSVEIDPTSILYMTPSDQYLTSQSKVILSKDANTSNLVMPVQIMAAIGENTLHNIGEFQKYDDKGNLLQYLSESGIPTTIIYGYNQIYPIAKIEGATYNEVMGALNLSNSTISYLSSDIYVKSNLDKDEISENQLIDALDSFRKNPNLVNFQITTFTYNPLVGVTSVTLPSGMREIYSYDLSNRLKEVKRQEKDSNGNFIYRTLQEKEYYHKP